MKCFIYSLLDNFIDNNDDITYLHINNKNKYKNTNIHNFK